MSISVPFELGLHEVAEGTHAYLQPDGGWGWSNAGLVVGDDASLLVDTLFDLRLTADMLDTMAVHTSATPISTLVNTHANGDHCYGNQLVAGAEIIASAAAAAEMDELPPAALAAMMAIDHAPDLARYLAEAFGPFEFDGITPTPPTRTFEKRLSIEVGGLAIELIEVGPAHTKGDVLVHIPDRRVLFTGDILFIEGTPIVWDGPFSNWEAACDLIAAMDLDVIVPGHGPLADADGARAVWRYLDHVRGEAALRHGEGMSVVDAANDIELGEFAGWGEAERIVINVAAVYRELDPSFEPPDIMTLFGAMARYRG